MHPACGASHRATAKRRGGDQRAGCQCWRGRWCWRWRCRQCWCWCCGCCPGVCTGVCAGIGAGVRRPAVCRATVRRPGVRAGVCRPGLRAGVRRPGVRAGVRRPGVRPGMVVFVYCMLALMYLLPQLQKIDLVVYLACMALTYHAHVASSLQLGRFVASLIKPRKNVKTLSQTASRGFIRLHRCQRSKKAAFAASPGCCVCRGGWWLVDEGAVRSRDY
jgi:hypothetical protein